ncbi:MAG: hypothetical protein U5L75_00335 [Candidatus Campbellbacteria bacterium]|nr:hypothetical protein [Candidatus Campbellbacteria bacterium]
MANVEVEANTNEPNSSVVRRFTQRVRGSGLLRIARGGRYLNREKSKFIKKKEALKSIERKNEIERLKKLGKLPE